VSDNDGFYGFSADALFHVGISGGKDSTAVLLWLTRESGIPADRINATFCDTGNELDETYAFVARLSDTVHPIRTVMPERDFYELARWKGRFPSPKARFCTEHLKIRPAMKHVKELQDAGEEVVITSGVRGAESPERAKLADREWDTAYDCEHWRPILHWSIDDVWAIHKRHGIAPNPLYAAGMKRVGCAPCIMSRKAELAIIARRFPERIDVIRAAEERMQTETERAGGSFFKAETTPLRYRSWIWQRAGTDDIKPDAAPLDAPESPPGPGQLLNVKEHGSKPKFNRYAIPMIDDIVRWALDGEAASEAQGELFEQDGPAACADRWGLCE
jgi:3'-phosphoadenosine 5'-phosphosulfate sulfotransferase (PAPS reductase)/FAD synthetase